MTLHLTLLATLLYAAVAIPLSGTHEAIRSTNQLANSPIVGNLKAADVMAAKDFCTLNNVFCPTKCLMRITEYGATGNLTASGKVPRVGMVATSDRSIPFGSKVEIEGRTYSVEDRTNKRIENTIDIFSENPRGLSYKVVYFK